MRVRAATTFVLVLLAATAAVPLVPASAAPFVVAQEQSTNEDEGVVNDADETESENVNRGKGKEAEAETGAGEGEQESAEEETGPLWTYQMVWLSLGLLVLLGLGMARWYYMLVGRRQRSGI